MSEILITKDYLDILKKYHIFLKGNVTDESLLFKSSDKNKVYISHMDGNTSIWLNVGAPTSQINFDVDKIALMSLNDFIKYSYLINKDDNRKILYKDVSNSGKNISTLQFAGNGVKYYLPLANPGHFINPYDTKIPTNRDELTHPLKAKFILKPNDLIDLVNGIKAMETPNTFGLGIQDNLVSFYARGTKDQQFEKSVDPLCSKVFDSYTTTEIEENGGCKLFSSNFLFLLSLFNIEFDIDFRLVNGKSSSLMAYGNIITENKDTIEITVGTLENISTSITGTFSILNSR